MQKKVCVVLICAAFLLLSYNRIAASQEVDEGVRIFLNSLEDAIYKMDTYRYIMTSENWKGKRHEKKTLRFQFKKPNLIRTDVLEGKKRGSTVILNKEDKVRGRNSWGLRKTMKPTDKRLRSIRGSTFMQASLSDKLKRLKEHILERGCIAGVSEEEYTGRPAYRLHIDHQDEDDPVTAEDIWFDKETYVTLKNLKYEDDNKVADVTWKDFEINIPLDDSLFEL